MLFLNIFQDVNLEKVFEYRFFNGAGYFYNYLIVLDKQRCKNKVSEKRA